MFEQMALSESINLFLKEKGKKSDRTELNYRTDIDHYFNAVYGKSYEHVTIEELNKETHLYNLMRYFNELYDAEKDGARCYANATINRKQASIKELLKDLRVKRIYYNDLSDLDAIKNLPKNTRRIENIQHDKALEYAEWLLKNEKFKGVEKYYIIMLALDTGLRASELLALKWNQFIEEEEHVLLTGYGKGNKFYSEKLNKRFYNELKENLNDDNLFTLSYSDLATMINRVKKAFGDSDRAISFHSFKKRAVTTAYRLTGDIKEAKRKGRHSNLGTTDGYLEEEDYGITGLISLGGDTDNELYKKVDTQILMQALEEMKSDFIYILNSKIRNINEKEEK